MALPKAVLPGPIWVGTDVAELEAITSVEALQPGELGWAETEQAWYVADTVGPASSTWARATGIGDLLTVDAILRDGSQPFVGDQSLGGNRLTDLGAPTTGQDAATKEYVDDVATGLVIKDSVRAATTAPGILSTDFAAGSVIDGVTLAAGDRILIKDQSAAAENGIYVVQAAGAPVRAPDADEDFEVDPGMTTFVLEGTLNQHTKWVLVTPEPITVGTTPLTFTKFSGDVTLTTAPPADVSKSPASPGTSTEAARADHKHDVVTAAAVAVGTANAEGSATSLARSDHTHQVTGLVESGGPTGLTIGAIMDGQFLRRSGTSVVGATAAGGGFNPSSISASSDVTISATSDFPIPSMSLTPPTGSYTVFFWADILGTAGVTAITSIYVGGVQMTNTETSHTVAGRYATTVFGRIATVTGSQAIEARVRTVGGSVGFFQRRLMVVPE